MGRIEDMKGNNYLNYLKSCKILASLGFCWATAGPCGRGGLVECKALSLWSVERCLKFGIEPGFFFVEKLKWKFSRNF